MDPELGSDIGERQPSVYRSEARATKGSVIFPGDAATGYAPPIELSDDRGPVDAVAPRERIDRRPLFVEVHKFIDDTSRQPSLHGV